MSLTPLNSPNRTGNSYTQSTQTSDAEKLAQQSKDFNAEIRQKLESLAARTKERAASGLDIHKAATVRAEMAETAVRELCPDAPPELIAQMKELIAHSSTSIAGVERQNPEKANENMQNSTAKKAEELRVQQAQTAELANKLQNTYENYYAQKGLVAPIYTRQANALALQTDIQRQYSLFSGPASTGDLQEHARFENRAQPGNWSASFAI
jgi:exonuclease VII large subunit